MARVGRVRLTAACSLEPAPAASPVQQLPWDATPPQRNAARLPHAADAAVFHFLTRLCPLSSVLSALRCADGSPLSRPSLTPHRPLIPPLTSLFPRRRPLGRKITGAYAVTQGSHMDIDMRVYNPKSLLVFEAIREGEGKFTIPADADGSYKLCFSNKMSMVSHKTVKLVVDNGEGPDLTGLAKKEHMDSVEQTLITIAHSARMIAFHQEEYRQLHDRHLVSTFLLGGGMEGI